MNRDSRLLSGDEIRELLTELGRRLASKGIEAHLFLVGGAAMALAYNVRRSTRDLDAVFEPKQVVYSEAALMAEDNGLPPDWLNDGVKGLLPDKPDDGVGTQFTSEGISVQVASAEYLFAMKAQSARADGDREDVAFLAEHVGITTASAAVALVERYYDKTRISPKTQYFLEEIMADLEKSSGGGER